MSIVQGRRSVVGAITISALLLTFSVAVPAIGGPTALSAASLASKVKSALSTAKKANRTANAAKAAATAALAKGGPTGPTGPAGAAGAKGDTGATGAAGAKGDTGAAGAAGAQGDRGPSNAKSATGSGNVQIGTQASPLAVAQVSLGAGKWVLTATTGLTNISGSDRTATCTLNNGATELGRTRALDVTSQRSGDATVLGVVDLAGAATIKLNCFSDATQVFVPSGSIPAIQAIQVETLN